MMSCLPLSPRFTRLVALCAALFLPLLSAAPGQPVSDSRFSTAGFYQLKDSGRTVENFNVGWRFHLGAFEGAELGSCDDKAWPVVSLPHGLELLPLEASGGRNYQGQAWYRKRFVLPVAHKEKRFTLHFEGIMGKSRVYLDGKLVKRNFAGYLPVSIDLSGEGLAVGSEHLIAVCTDNGDDSSFPPGKPQAALDFAYFGGIYRDVWLVATSPVHITDPNHVDTRAGGGVFVHCDEVSEARSVVGVDTDIVNESNRDRTITLQTSLCDATGVEVARSSEDLPLRSGEARQVKQSLTLENARLWHPNDPYLYKVTSLVLSDGKPLDGFYTRVGVRRIEFRGTAGFFLNGKPFGDKLIGQNRHQDFAHIGNAVPNSLHWRDAKKLRDAHNRIIRSHYPQDPAFMDACDELGLFCIVSTVGWQFWNDDPIFAARVYSDIRHAVRRDRNHASIILWEPILNETHYPASFAEAAYRELHAEYPYQGCFAACDINTPRWELYDVIYAHPLKPDEYARYNKCFFTREWGDNVDDWYSHNASNRVARDWGEAAQLVQALHYGKASPRYPWACYDTLHKAPAAHVGGCMWHSFDHQRGYHPDPFLGGIMDAFRQPKYSYDMFKSQRPPQLRNPAFECGYSLFIAHEMTPFSPADVTVFTNADAVRLTVNGREPLTQVVEHSSNGLPHPPVVFRNVYDFMAVKSLQRANSSGSILAEGLVNGKVVVSSTRVPANRSEKLSLSIDHEGQAFVADGSDIVVVIASVTDRDGVVRRLAKEKLVFTVEGEASLVSDPMIGSNPRVVEWGTAPVLLRSTVRAGKIRLRVESAYPSTYAPKPAVLEFESVPSGLPLNFTEAPSAGDAPASALARVPQGVAELQEKLRQTAHELNQLRLKEVARDQEAFENTRKD